MLLVLVILDPHSVGSNDDIIVEAKLGELCVLEGNFDVERSAVFDGESLKVDFSQHVDVLVIDVSECNLNLCWFAHAWLWE